METANPALNLMSFVREHPVALPLPQAVWINPPIKEAGANSCPINFWPGVSQNH